MKIFNSFLLIGIVTISQAEIIGNFAPLKPGNLWVYNDNRNFSDRASEYYTVIWLLKDSFQVTDTITARFLLAIVPVLNVIDSNSIRYSLKRAEQCILKYRPLNVGLPSYIGILKGEKQYVTPLANANEINAELFDECVNWTCKTQDEINPSIYTERSLHKIKVLNTMDSAYSFAYRYDNPGHVYSYIITQNVGFSYGYSTVPSHAGIGGQTTAIQLVYFQENFNDSSPVVYNINSPTKKIRPTVLLKEKDGYLQTEYNLQYPDDIELRLINFQGKIIGIRNIGRVTEGKHFYVLKNVQGAGEVADGIYLLQFSAPKNSIKKMFPVINLH